MRYFPSIFKRFSRFQVLVFEVLEVLGLVQFEVCCPFLQGFQFSFIQRSAGTGQSHTSALTVQAGIAKVTGVHGLIRAHLKVFVHFHDLAVQVTVDLPGGSVQGGIPLLHHIGTLALGYLPGIMGRCLLDAVTFRAHNVLGIGQRGLGGAFNVPGNIHMPHIGSNATGQFLSDGYLQFLGIHAQGSIQVVAQFAVDLNRLDRRMPVDGENDLC